MYVEMLDMIARVLVRIILVINQVLYHASICYENGRKLFAILMRGTKTWIVMLSRLVLFTILLTPGWYQFVKYWIFCPTIIRNIEYGAGARKRNLLDIYLTIPSNHDELNPSDTRDGSPVVIFVSGGAWTIGYKLWSALVARALSCAGIVTIVPDYRNFPQGDIEDMMTDVKSSIEWTVRNARRFGGDPNKIVLAGQSAGAHICLTLLVSEYLEMKKKSEPGSLPSFFKTHGDAEPLKPSSDTGSEWFGTSYAFKIIQTLRQPFGVFGRNEAQTEDSQMAAAIEATWKEVPACDEDYPQDEKTPFEVWSEGPYNLLSLERHLHQRGLDSSILHYICRKNIEMYSPSSILTNFVEGIDQGLTATDPSNILQDFIPVTLFHGSLDASIPVSTSVELHSILKDHGAESYCKIYEGWTHTDAILEAPMSGNMRLMDDMVNRVRFFTESSNTSESHNIFQKNVTDQSRPSSSNKLLSDHQCQLQKEFIESDEAILQNSDSGLPRAKLISDTETVLVINLGKYQYSTTNSSRIVFLSLCYFPAFLIITFQKCGKKAKTYIEQIHPFCKFTIYPSWILLLITLATLEKMISNMKYYQIVSFLEPYHSDSVDVAVNSVRINGTMEAKSTDDKVIFCKADVGRNSRFKPMVPKWVVDMARFVNPF